MDTLVEPTSLFTLSSPPTYLAGVRAAGADESAASSAACNPASRSRTTFPREGSKYGPQVRANWFWVLGDEDAVEGHPLHSLHSLLSRLSWPFDHKRQSPNQHHTLSSKHYTTIPQHTPHRRTSAWLLNSSWGTFTPTTVMPGALYLEIRHSIRPRSVGTRRGGRIASHHIALHRITSKCGV